MYDDDVALGRVRSFFMIGNSIMEGDPCCPICLEAMLPTDNTLCMPVCLHELHTRCGLNAARFDARCPVCRSVDPDNIEQNKDSVSELVRLVDETERLDIQYARKRTNAFKQHSVLKDIREEMRKEMHRAKEQRRTCAHIRKRLERNQELVSQTRILKTCERRKRMLERRLEATMNTIIGARPEPIILNVDLSSIQFDMQSSSN